MYSQNLKNLKNLLNLNSFTILRDVLFLKFFVFFSARKAKHLSSVAIIMSSDCNCISYTFLVQISVFRSAPSNREYFPMQFKVDILSNSKTFV